MPYGSRHSGSRAELFRALAAIAEPPAPGHTEIAAALGLPGSADAAQHTEVFVLQCYPYASVHLGPEGMLGGEAADRVAGFWRALGLTPPAEPDHLATLLGLYAVLLEAAGEPDPERRAPADRAARALRWEHLLPWIPAFLLEVAAIGSAFYRGWAELALDALLAEAQADPHSGPAPLAFREAPGPVDPGEGGDAFLTSLLAPVRSGIILTRADLARAARATGLGLRLGERRFVLGAMLEQDPSATCAWLAGEADRWATRHRALVPELGPIAVFWEERAVRTAAALGAAAAAPAAMAATVAAAGPAGAPRGRPA